MKRKTRIALCMCSLLTGLGALALGSACKKETTANVKLVGFEDATVQITYRSDFSIGPYLSATDEQGNLYKGTAKVTDSDGEQVEVFANHFTVQEMTDYTAVITVETGEQTFERTLTLDVVDRSTPAIKIYDLRYGQVGVNYTLPAIEITKFSDEEIEPEIEVYYLGETKSEKMEIEDGAFMPQKKGLYKLVVTATDQYGTMNTAEKEFYVRSAMAKNMLEDFGDEVSVNNVTQLQRYKVGEPTWYETYDGASGVVKTTTADDYTIETGTSKVALKTCKTIAELKSIDFDYINIRVWIDKEGSFTVGSFNNRFETDVQGRTWQNLRLTKQAIETKNLASDGYKGSLYTQSLGENETPIDKFISYHNVNGTGDYLFWVELLPDGYTRAQLRTLKTENPELYKQLDEAKTGVDIYIDSIAYVKLQTEEYQTPQVGVPFTLPKVNLIGENGTKIDVNATATVTQSWDNQPLTVTDGKVTFPYGGTYYLNYSFTYGGIEYNSDVSIVIPRTLADGVLEDFNTPSATSGLRSGTVKDGGTNVSTWLESHTIGNVTKQGVAKLEIGYSDGKAIFVNFGRTLAELQAIDDDGWDYIELSIAFAQTDISFGWISFSNWSQTFGANTGAWRTVKITKESVMGMNGTTVKDSYWSYLAGANDGTAIDKLWELHSAEGTGYKFCDYINTPTDLTEQEQAEWKLTIYLDEIKLGKNA